MSWYEFHSCATRSEILARTLEHLWLVAAAMSIALC